MQFASVDEALLAKMQNRPIEEVTDMPITKTLGYVVRFEVEGRPAKEAEAEEAFIDAIEDVMVAMSEFSGTFLVTTGELDDGYQARVVN